ncbi:MAG: hypothetical protein ACI8QC_000164 [Planctomycetota bacterium]|jgi:preprotein translocase subunit SecG
MSNFLKENWVYIVIPIVLVVVGVIVLVMMSEGDPAAAFQYNI